MKISNHEMLEIINDVTDVIDAIPDVNTRDLLVSAGIGQKTIGATKVRQLIKEGAVGALVAAHNKAVNAYANKPLYKRFDFVDLLIVIVLMESFIVAYLMSN